MGKIIHNGVQITREITVPSMILTTSSDMNFTTADSEWTKLTLNSTSASVGNKLTLDTTNNEIVIGSGVSYISVSCGCTIILNSSGMTYQSIAIAKNNSRVSPYGQNRGSYNPSVQLYTTLSEILIPVQKGDKISMHVFNRLTGSITVGRIYMSVRVVK